MMTRRLCLLLVLSGCAVAPADRTETALAGLPPEDRAYALADTAFGFFRVAGDGTARGDTARRLLGAALWDLEGGDAARGLRLLDAALGYGVTTPDSLVYYDLDLVMQLCHRPAAQRLALLEQATTRWPGWKRLWLRRADVLAQLGQTREAEDARARAAALP